jgi:Zn-dependent protease
MNTLPDGSFRLMRFAGIDVFLHWSWFLVAMVQVRFGASRYRSPGWAVAEYVTLFAIVLLHELGHALACRSVGGVAGRIVLWPLGGIAYVSPPARPGAALWSIAAGPLVNLLLLPLTAGLLLLAGPLPDWRALFLPGLADAHLFLFTVAALNLGLLVFNLMPIYPLDGGQILYAALWFLLGRWRSLQAVSLLSLSAGAVGLAVALAQRAWWPALLAAFIAWRAALGYVQARAVLRRLRQARPARADATTPPGAPPAAGADAG